MGLLWVLRVHAENCHKLAFSFEAWMQDSGQVWVSKWNTCLTFINCDHSDNVWKITQWWVDSTGWVVPSHGLSPGLVHSFTSCQINEIANGWVLAVFMIYNHFDNVNAMTPWTLRVGCGGLGRPELLNHVLIFLKLILICYLDIHCIFYLTELKL